jgi:hypothetical protein
MGKPSNDGVKVTVVPLFAVKVPGELNAGASAGTTQPVSVDLAKLSLFLDHLQSQSRMGWRYRKATSFATNDEAETNGVVEGEGCFDIIQRLAFEQMSATFAKARCDSSRLRCKFKIRFVRQRRGPGGLHLRDHLGKQ